MQSLNLWGGWAFACIYVYNVHTVHDAHLRYVISMMASLNGTGSMVVGPWPHKMVPGELEWGVIACMIALTTSGCSMYSTAIYCNNHKPKSSHRNRFTCIYSMGGTQLSKAEVVVMLESSRSWTVYTCFIKTDMVSTVIQQLLIGSVMLITKFSISTFSSS